MVGVGVDSETRLGVILGRDSVGVYIADGIGVLVVVGRGVVFLVKYFFADVGSDSGLTF